MLIFCMTRIFLSRKLFNLVCKVANSDTQSDMYYVVACN